MSTETDITRSDRDAALRRVLTVFWQQGAESTSYNDIVKATGLSRKALYAQWPDKEALIHAVMMLYRTEVLTVFREALALGGRRGLEAFWQTAVAGSASPGWRGCFLFRSANGVLGTDPTVQRHLDEHVQMLRAHVVRAIEEAQVAGEVPASVDPQAAGWQVAAITALMSTYGAMSGNGPAVAHLINAGRVACGLTAVLCS